MHAIDTSSISVTRRLMLVVVAAVVQLTPAPAHAQSKNLAAGFDALPRTARIAIMPTDIELFSISAGGLLEPKADWTEAASKHFRAALLEKKKKLDLREAGKAAETLDALRFEYALTRKVDNVELLGLGYGTVSKAELFAIVYMAPRLTFFARHRIASSTWRKPRG